MSELVLEKKDDMVCPSCKGTLSGTAEAFTNRGDEGWEKGKMGSCYCGNNFYAYLENGKVIVEEV